MIRPSKRFWTRLGIGLGTGLAGLGAAYAWLLPSIVRARAEQALEGRLGMDATVGSARMGLGSTTLESVVLTGRKGGLRVSLGEVEADAGLGIALRGTTAVDEVVARRVLVDVDFGAAGAPASVAAIRRALSSGGSTGSTGRGAGGRSYRVEDLTVHAKGPSGRAVDLGGATLQYAGGRLDGRATDARLASPAGHRVKLVEPAVALVRGDEGWQLQSLEVGSGTVLLRQASPEEPEAAGPPPPADEAAGGLQDRIADVLTHLASDTDVDLGHLDVRTVGDDGEHPLMHDLSIRVQGHGLGVLSSTGVGHAAGGGELRWDMKVRPTEARAEGTVTLKRLPLALVTPLLPDLPWYRPEDARLDGELAVHAESAASLAVRGRVALTGAALQSPRIAPVPVEGISLLVEGEGHWIPTHRRLVIDSASLALGQASLDLKGALEWASDHYAIDLVANLPPTHCGQASGAIPADLLGDVAGFTLQGHLAGRLEVHVDSRDLDATDLDIHVADGCQFVSVPAAADLRRFRGVFVHRVEEPDGSTFEMTTGPGSGNWQPIRSVSPYLVHAVVAHEDAAFFRHHGFAPWAIEEALARDLKAGRFVVGASTITMQLAKNLFLHREKTLARKVQEVLLTWWLESALDKGDILELYLNVIEFGPSVYGIKNAAWHYFGRSPADLSPAESAFLASILPDPKDHAAEYQRDTPSASTKNRMRRLLEHMASKGLIDQAALDYARSEVESMHFHHEGDPPAEPRTIPGQPAPLPLGIADEVPGAMPADWQGMFDAATAGGDAPPPDSPFRELPQVDPDAL